MTPRAFAARRAGLGPPRTLRRPAGGLPDFSARQTALEGLPKAAHLLGCCPVGIELGHSPAMARGFLVVDPGEDQRRNQPSHFFERLDAVLHAGRLLRGRTLIEQKHEVAADFLRVRALAQRSNMLGREGIMLRSATCIAADDAAPSAPGVSRIARVKPLRSSEARRAGRRAAPEAMTSISLLPRVLAQCASEPCGSMSMTQTFSFISCAATASEDAIVLFPEPPF